MNKVREEMLSVLLDAGGAHASGRAAVFALKAPRLSRLIRSINPTPSMMVPSSAGIQNTGCIVIVATDAT
jgi:hypothetical protein